MRHAHAAADQHVVADDAAVLDDGQQAEVLGVDVDAVVVRQRQAGLELARQVDLAVDRLRRSAVRRGCRDRLAVEPDFVVGAGARREVGGEPGGRRLQLGVDAVVPVRRRAGHDVALHVAAGAQRGQQARR